MSRELHQELEWDDWSYYDHEHDFEFYEHGLDDDELCFGWHRDDSAQLLGGLLSGDELRRLLEPALWQKLEALPLPCGDILHDDKEEWESLPSDELIEALLERCQQLRAAKQWNHLVTAPDEDIQALRSLWRASDAKLTAKTAPEGYCLPYQLGLIVMLEPFWLRPAVQWQRPEGDDRVAFASLLEHLFVRYRVPRFLLDGVDWVADRCTWKWLLWIVLLGSGASMVRAGRRLGWWMNTALMNQLMNAPPHLDGTSACIWAEVQRLGGSSALAYAISESRHFRLDPTEVDIPEAPRAEPLRRLSEMQVWHLHRHEDERLRAEWRAFRQFWQVTLEWLAKHESTLPIEDVSHILEWSNHEFTEQRRYIVPDAGADQSQLTARTFSWKGRTPAATLRLTNEYHERLRRRRGPNRQWNSRGWDWQGRIESDATWSARELTCSDELFSEGEAMHHCVGLYDWHCVAGTSAVFSLCRDSARVLTIEIDPITHDIRQAYGECNRRATSAELEVVKRWKTEAVEAAQI